MYLNTARIPWAVLRAKVDSSDSALTSFDRGDWPTSNIIKLKDPPMQDANGLVIAFHGSDAENETAAYKLYGVTRSNGPVQLLLAGVITLGTQVADEDPIDISTVIANGLWADTVTVTSGILSDSAITQILDSANNRICMLKFDQTHIDELYLEVSLTTAASIYGIISGF